MTTEDIVEQAVGERETGVEQRARDLYSWDARIRVLTALDDAEKCIRELRAEVETHKTTAESMTLSLKRRVEEARELGSEIERLRAEVERLQRELTAEIASTEREREAARKDTGREISDRILDYRDALRHRGTTPRPSHIEDCARFAREIGGAV